MVQYLHPYMMTGKIIALTRLTFIGKAMFLFFNILPTLVIAFVPRSKCLLISSAVILEWKKIKSLTVSIVSPSICHGMMGPNAMIFIFWMLSFKPAFPLSFFTFIKKLFSSSLSTKGVGSSAYLRLLIVLSAILIPACASSSQEFHMMYSAYKINEQGENKYIALMHAFPDLKPVCCFMYSSNCCFLTCIQISQEPGKGFWYTHHLKIFPTLLWSRQSKALV